MGGNIAPPVLAGDVRETRSELAPASLPRGDEQDRSEDCPWRVDPVMAKGWPVTPHHEGWG